LERSTTKGLCKFVAAKVRLRLGAECGVMIIESIQLDAVLDKVGKVHHIAVRSRASEGRVRRQRSYLVHVGLVEENASRVALIGREDHCRVYMLCHVPSCHENRHDTVIMKEYMNI